MTPVMAFRTSPSSSSVHAQIFCRMFSRTCGLDAHGRGTSKAACQEIRSVMSNIINCRISWNHIKLYIRYRLQAGHSLHLSFLFILHYYTLLVTDLFPGFRMTSTIPGAVSKDVFRFFFHPEAQPGCRCSASFLLS